MKKLYFFLLPLMFLFTNLFANSQESFCSPDDALILTDRGTVTDTPCTVPFRQIVLEGGYQHQSLIGGGNLSTLPQTEFSLGLPGDSEFFVDFPTYDYQTTQLAGWGAPNLGTKHLFFSNKDFAISAEGFITLPTGNPNFGSANTGVTVNAISAYSFNEKLILASMLGGSSLVEPVNLGGRRFNSFNYSVVLSYKFIERLVLFSEMYGQTQPSPGLGNGLNGDIGLYFVVNKCVVLDVEYSQRLQGAIGGWENYVGAGATVLFG